MERCQCSKETKIDAMEKKLEKLHRVVLESSNGDSLYSMTKHNNEYVQEMHSDVKDLGTSVHGLIQFQTQVETERQLKQRLRERRDRQQMWLIGILVGTAVSLLTLLVGVLS